MCCQYSYCLVIQIRMVFNHLKQQGTEGTPIDTTRNPDADDDTKRIIIARARGKHNERERAGEYRRVCADDEDARDVVKTR